MSREKTKKVQVVGELQRPGLLFTVSAEHAQGQDRIGYWLLSAGLEACFIQADQPRVRLWIDKQPEVVRQSALCRQHCAVRAGAQHPQGNVLRRPRADQRLGFFSPQVIAQLGHQLWKLLEFGASVGGQGDCRGHIRTGGAADAQVHPSRVEIGQQRKHFRDLIGAVVRQHDTAGADADVLSGRPQGRQQDLGCAARHGAEGVMFRHPETLVAELLTPLRHLQRLLQGGGGLVGGAGQGLIQYGQFQGHACFTW